MDSQRQKKISAILQEDLSEIIRQDFQPTGSLVTVSEVQTTPDLSIAKIYISVFPDAHRASVFGEIESQTPYIRKLLGNRIAQIVRIVPEIQFKLDTSLDNASQVDRELRGNGENPIK